MRLRQTESTARALLRHDVPRERFVYNLRSERLRNPKTGRQLELAIYCPARNFATEVDGIRHGLFVPDMQKDFNHFVEQQAKDMHKIKTSKARGITVYKGKIFELTA